MFSFLFIFIFLLEEVLFLRLCSIESEFSCEFVVIFFFFLLFNERKKTNQFLVYERFLYTHLLKKKKTFFCKEIKYGAAHIFVKMIYNSCCQQPIKNIINLNIVIFQLNRVKVWNISWQYFFCLSLIVYFYK